MTEPGNLAHVYSKRSQIPSSTRLDASYDAIVIGSGIGGATAGHRIGEEAPLRFDTAINQCCPVVLDVDAAADAPLSADILPARELLMSQGRVLFIPDPDGNIVELIRPLARAFQRGAADSVARGEPSMGVATSTMSPLW
jgi:fermentation-respiration switch protein FrsA (DUF1100 family)